MCEVSMYKVKNEYILARLWMPSIGNFIHYRRLVWMGKIANMPLTRNPRIFPNAWISLPRPVGRPNLTVRESFLKSLMYCSDHGTLDFNCTTGKLENWILIAPNKIKWTEAIEFLRETRFLKEVDFYKTYPPLCTDNIWIEPADHVTSSILYIYIHCYT